MLLIPGNRGTGEPGNRGTGEPGNRETGKPGTGDRETGTGVWELVYSGNPLEDSKWRTKQKKSVRK